MPQDIEAISEVLGPGAEGLGDVHNKGGPSCKGSLNLGASASSPQETKKNEECGILSCLPGFRRPG